MLALPYLMIGFLRVAFVKKCKGFEMMKIRIIFSTLIFALLSACGGGGVDTAGSEDAAAALVQKIRNAAAAVSVMTVVNSANN